MRMIQLAALASLLFLISPLHAMSQETVVTGVRGDTVYINFQAVQTQGNWSYIPLNLPGTPDINQTAVLRVLHTFETHMSYDIISFQVQYRNLGYDRGGSMPPYTSGIWVHHKTKPKSQHME